MDASLLLAPQTRTASIFMTLNITPSWSATESTPIQHSWAGMVNIDQFHWLTRRDVQDLLARARDEIGAEHVRACAMYAGITKTLERDPQWFRSGAPKSGGRANFRITDYVFDSLLDRGLRPIFTTCFMPPILAASEKRIWNDSTFPTRANDYAAWRDFIAEHVKHTLDRYGKRETREWYFECWNEPNLESFFDGSKEDFFKLWKETWLAIKSIDPEIRLGGPSTARAEWIEEFLEWSEKAPEIGLALTCRWPARPRSSGRRMPSAFSQSNTIGS
jgi:xylan 1,4-beta-xylosidase